MENLKTTTPTPLRIAIAGGGLAGATLIYALQKYSHLDVNIYESRAEFSERGAAVGLSQNSLRALNEIGANMKDLLDDAGAVSIHSSVLCIVSYIWVPNYTHRSRMTFFTGIRRQRGYDSLRAWS
jgi:hypothetical protein